MMPDARYPEELKMGPTIGAPTFRHLLCLAPYKMVNMHLQSVNYTKQH